MPGAANLRFAGLHDVEVEDVPIVFQADSIDNHVARVSSLAGPMAAAFKAASPELIAAVR